jgi:hypothetical protein
LGIFAGSDVVIKVDGQVIGKAQSLSYAPDPEIKPIGRPMPHLEGSFTATGGIMKAGEDFFNSLFNPTFDVTVRKSKHLPPRKLRSKKKRILRKWYKKYSYEVESAVYKDCVITGVSE